MTSTFESSSELTPKLAKSLLPPRCQRNEAEHGAEVICKTAMILARKVRECVANGAYDIDRTNTNYEEYVANCSSGLTHEGTRCTGRWVCGHAKLPDFGDSEEMSALAESLVARDPA